jgi:hypothetical protein
MNKLIYELAEKAGAYCEVLSGGDYKPPVLYNMNLEKFAESIIRSCTDYSSRNWEHGDLLAQDLLTYFGLTQNE